MTSFSNSHDQRKPSSWVLSTQEPAWHLSLNCSDFSIWFCIIRLFSTPGRLEAPCKQRKFYFLPQSLCFAEHRDGESHNSQSQKGLQWDPLTSALLLGSVETVLLKAAMSSLQWDRKDSAAVCGYTDTYVRVGVLLGRRSSSDSQRRHCH